MSKFDIHMLGLAVGPIHRIHWYVFVLEYFFIFFRKLTIRLLFFIVFRNLFYLIMHWFVQVIYILLPFLFLCLLSLSPRLFRSLSWTCIFLILLIKNTHWIVKEKKIQGHSAETMIGWAFNFFQILNINIITCALNVMNRWLYNLLHFFILLHFFHSITFVDFASQIVIWQTYFEIFFQIGRFVIFCFPNPGYGMV